MYVAYRYENPNSLNILYFSICGATSNLTEAMKFKDEQDLRAYFTAMESTNINHILNDSEKSEWFIGELCPTCRGFLGEFGH